jgi:hypothetical protein
LGPSDIGRMFSEIGHFIENIYLIIRIFDTNMTIPAINNLARDL